LAASQTLLNATQQLSAAKSAVVAATAEEKARAAEVIEANSALAKLQESIRNRTFTPAVKETKLAPVAEAKEKPEKAEKSEEGEKKEEESKLFAEELFPSLGGGLAAKPKRGALRQSQSMPVPSKPSAPEAKATAEPKAEPKPMGAWGKAGGGAKAIKEAEEAKRAKDAYDAECRKAELAAKAVVAAATAAAAKASEAITAAEQGVVSCTEAVTSTVRRGRTFGRLGSHQEGRGGGKG